MWYSRFIVLKLVFTSKSKDPKKVVLSYIKYNKKLDKIFGEFLHFCCKNWILRKIERKRNVVQQKLSWEKWPYHEIFFYSKLNLSMRKDILVTRILISRLFIGRLLRENLIY